MNAFEQGFISALEKRARLVRSMADAVNTMANLKVLGDITNISLSETLDDKKPDSDRDGRKNGRGNRKIRMSVDKELLSSLTPEQRKQLFFAVRGIKVQ